MEGTETGLHSIQRAGQDGFATDTKKMLHKWWGGGISKYNADGTGYTGVDGVDVTYSYGGWVGVDNVKEALDDLKDESDELTVGSGNVTMLGLTGTTLAQYTWTLKNNIAEFTLVSDATNYGNNSAVTLKMKNFPIEIWPTATNTRLICSVRDSDFLTSGYGTGQMKIPAYSGLTGAETGIECSIFKTDSISSAPEAAASGWGATGIHGILRGSWRFPLEATV